MQGALRSSASTLVLPAVSWPASNAVIGQLQDHLETSPLYMDPETLSQLRLNASSSALLVFRLPYGTGYVCYSSNNDSIKVIVKKKKEFMMLHIQQPKRRRHI